MIDTFIAVDIETTGLNPEKDKIIEIGAVKVTNSIITGKYKSLINPYVPISDMISSLTGITEGMLCDALSAKEVLKEFLEFAVEEPILGHNIIFDYSFLKVNYAKMGIPFERYGIDTLKLSRSLHSEQKSKSLENMCNFYQINNEHAHRAFDDAKAAYDLYYKLRNEFDKREPKIFKAEQLCYSLKKIEKITIRQRNYLNDLIKYHKIVNAQPISELSKSDASRLIDKIILSHGRMF